MSGFSAGKGNGPKKGYNSKAWYNNIEKIDFSKKSKKKSCATCTSCTCNRVKQGAVV